ncbi:MAG: alpha-L-fucosidase [Bacteroidales bacterium]|nr:alpha-L-fucosidase [Bacteroidales bacterium]
MRLLLLLLFTTVISHNGFTQSKTWQETEEERTERMQWWTNARFGMFIHWGIYSEAARGEWVKTNERMSEEEYRKYFDIFNPDLYDPVEWAKAAKKAGMKYVIITSKHHDGFCLWDSEYTDYDAAETPYGKDLLKPFVEAFRNEGLRVGFYYSGPDWHHPKYPINHGSLIHPLRDHKDVDKLNQQRDIKEYTVYMKNQIRELLTDFGTVDLFWSDYGSDVTVRGEENELVDFIRGLQPEVIMNDRLFSPDLLSGWGTKWDYRSPEQTMPSKGGVIMEGKKVPWEICHTLNGSWGYSRNVGVTNRHGWKSDEQLINLIIETVSKGGNLLLNVGPTARGKFCNKTMERLDGIGKWMEYNSRSIYGCSEAPEEFKAPDNCLLTYNPEMNRLYVHILKWPARLLHFDKYYAGKVKHARFLHDSSELQFSGGTAHWDWVWTGDKEARTDRSGILETVPLMLGIEKPDVCIPVIELILENE